MKFEKIELKSNSAILVISLASALRGAGAEGSESRAELLASVLASLSIKMNAEGVTGGNLITENAANDCYYSVEGSVLTIHLSGLRLGSVTRVNLSAKYGTNTDSLMVIDLVVPEVADGEAEEHHLGMDAVSTIGGGGSADYKADQYFDAGGRLLVERAEDGSTIIYDEHENPIIKRAADGTTAYYDAYQSARLLISEHGDISLNYTEDETIKTLQLAEAILARTKKRLLTNVVGEETIKDEQGNILTHEQIYAMLMNTPDFVVLVRADHAFHPNLVTPTQIAFTCSYLGADGQISAERVNITSENVVTYTSGNGVTAAANGGVSIGDATIASGKYSFAHGWLCEATGEHSHAEGYNTTASGRQSHAEGYKCVSSASQAHAEGSMCVASNPEAHAEGLGCKAVATQSHAEGTSCQTNAATSHAEGNYCETGTNGGSAHAEGSYTNANGAASHTEGYRTTTTAGGQHAQGCWNAEVAEEFAFMHGCGTSADDKKNALLIVGQAIYLIGIGGFDGTNHTAEGVQSLQEVLLS